MSDSDKVILRTIAKQLEKWASDSVSGGWSTHHVKPQRDLAMLIYAHLGRTMPVDDDEPAHAGGDGPEPDLMATDYREGLELGHPEAGR